MPEPQSDSAPRPAAGPPRLVIALVIVAILVTVGAVVTGFVMAARIGQQSSAPQTGPVAVPAAPAPGAAGRHCAALMAALPDTLGSQPRRPLLVEEPGVAAWGDPAIILRCGLSDPAELTCAASLTSIGNAAGNRVQWLRIAEGAAVTYLAVDRPVRVALTVPDAAGSEPVQQLSDVIDKTLAAQPVCTGGNVNPVDND